MKKTLLIHPFIIVSLPVLHLYSINYKEYPFSVFVQPLFILIFLMGIFLFVLNMIVKNYHKTGAILSILCFWFFSYGSVRLFFERIDFIFYRHRFLISLFLITLIIVIFLITRLSMDFKKITQFLNHVSFIILFAVAISFLFNIYHGRVGFAHVDKIVFENRKISQNHVVPNIYYIILDSYVGSEELNDILYYDNSSFIQYLRQKGFFVASKSYSNYSWTQPSIASQLNMEYLPAKLDANSKNSYLEPNSRRIQMITENKVKKFLISRGYKYYDLSIWDLKYKKIDFYIALLRMSILSVPGVENYLSGFFFREDTKNKLNLLGSIPSGKGPFFVYAHIMAPHQPFVFDRNGDRPSVFKIDEEVLYLDQITYINREIKKIIEIIFEREKTKPIIILQGDHGAPRFGKENKDYVRLRMSIIQACYFPSEENKNHSGFISPANLFRIIFNRYFETDFKLLPYKAYYQDSEAGRLIDFYPN